jgi:hypothetical protein
MDQIADGNLFVKNSIFFDNAGGGNFPATPSMPLDFPERMIFMDASWSNREVDPGMPTDAFSLTSPKFALGAGSAALGGGATPPSDGFFEPATFVGAVGAEDWTQGWTAYPQPAP